MLIFIWSLIAELALAPSGDVAVFGAEAGFFPLTVGYQVELDLSDGTVADSDFRVTFDNATIAGTVLISPQFDTAALTLRVALSNRTGALLRRARGQQ